MVSVCLYIDEYERSLIDLLRRVHEHYHQTLPEQAAVEAHLRDNILSDGSPLQLVIAADGETEAVGFAAIYFVHSLVEPYPDANRQCHLKELFVRADQRGKRVGEQLMAWIASYALEQGCSRVDWPVKALNSAGIAFYERLGAQRVKDRLSYRLSENAMVKLARPT